MAEWLEIVVPTPASCADDIAAILAERVPAASNGTELRSNEIVFWAEVPEGEQALHDTRAAVDVMRDAGFDIDPARVYSRPAVPEQEWRDAWKKYFHVTRITRRLVIVPSWETHDPADDDIVLHLDPGQAFGTGAHATTKLVLCALQQLADEGVEVRRLLDVGTGSGILTIAAAALWPGSSGIAIDTDPLAVSASTENFERNGVGIDRFHSSADALEDVGGEYDLVVANIRAPILIDLRDALLSRVAANGRVVLSGVLANQAESVSAAYREAGVEVHSVELSEDDPEWCSVRLRRP
jgi:ribosomal protein L11 methyltransferase